MHRIRSGLLATVMTGDHMQLEEKIMHNEEADIPLQFKQMFKRMFPEILKITLFVSCLEYHIFPIFL